MTYLFSHPVVTLLVKDHTRNILHCGGLHTSEFSIKLEKKSGASRAKNFSFFFVMSSNHPVESPSEQKNNGPHWFLLLGS